VAPLDSDAGSKVGVVMMVIGGVLVLTGLVQASRATG
jgi:hypothetical protein